MGVLLQELSVFPRRKAFGIGQRPRVVGRGLAMGSERCRACPGSRCETQHRPGVTGPLGVVSQTGQVRRAVRRLGEDHQGATVQRQGAVGAHRFGDCNPR